MRYTKVIGIDIGSTGAAVSCDLTDGIIDVCRFKTPTTEADIKRFLTHHCQKPSETIVVVEKVSSSPQMGVTSAFTFGYNKGLIYGLVTALDVRLDEVLPAKWQRALGIPPRKRKTKKQAGESITEHKAKLRHKAERLFPDRLFRKDYVDAFLIMEYARTIHLKNYV